VPAPPWVKKINASHGKPYYWNPVTGETSFVLPKVVAVCGWVCGCVGGCAHIHTYTYISTHIHTHTHTHRIVTS
jgi:hypothetical protein